MALTSPRFTGNGRLQTTSSNDPAMNWGEVGTGVQLVQQALTDLGFPLLLDGIFGDNTKSQVVAFQRRNNLIADGVVGKVTLTNLNEHHEWMTV